MLKTALAIMAFAFSAAPALAAPVIGGPIVVLHTGDVTATYLGTQARFTDLLMFSGKTIFNNKTSKVGDVVDLGTFAAGTLLNFQLRVLDTHQVYTTGPSLGNINDVVQYATSGTTLGFEDVKGGGDKDYNDLMTFVSNTGATAAPEPAAWAMMITGFGFIGGFMRRKTRLHVAYA